MQGWVLPHLVAWVDKQGCDGTSISRLPGLADLTDPDTRVPEALAETAWRMATTMTGDAAIGVHVAESLPRGALDLVEYAFRSSASLAAGLERLARYGRVLKARHLVGVRGAGPAFDGLHYVTKVTHSIKRGEYKQRFQLTREGLGATVPAVIP